MGKVFYIADLHFGHKNIMSYDDRPFNTVEEHDDFVIKSWNETVGIDDDVYILGDLSWYGSMKSIDIFSNLNGTKHLIKGNHDKRLLKNKDFRGQFCEIVDYKEIVNDNGQVEAVLSHYPILFWNNQHRGAKLLYGHVHNSREEDYFQNVLKHVNRGDTIRRLDEPEFKAFNVGAMMVGYKPRTLQEIIDGNYDSTRREA